MLLISLDTLYLMQIMKYQNFTKKQIRKLVQLCKNLKRKYRIKNNFILGHSDIAPLRKIDPGEKFPWHYLSSNGIGFYPGNIRNVKEVKIRKI